MPLKSGLCCRAAGLQGCVALAKDVDIALAPDEAHVRDGVDEPARLLKHPALDLMSPELLGDFERFGNAHGLADVDAAIGFLRRVAELAEGGVSGAGVVPGIGTLVGHARQAFVDLHGQLGSSSCR